MWDICAALDHNGSLFDSRAFTGAVTVLPALFKDMVDARGGVIDLSAELVAYIRATAPLAGVRPREHYQSYAVFDTIGELLNAPPAATNSQAPMSHEPERVVPRISSAASSGYVVVSFVAASIRSAPVFRR